jgi:hypothetical protein
VTQSVRDATAGLAELRRLGQAELAYALDDGMPFPGWAPPLISTDEARAGYDAGERIAVLCGNPQDPAAGIVLDRGNARLAVRIADPPLQLVYAGKELALAEARWTDARGRQCWARRTSAGQLRVARRPAEAIVWVEELIAARAAGDDPGLTFPDFESWDELPAAVTASAPKWIADGALAPVDADGWMLDALEASGVLSEWRELGRKYDAPRAFGLPPEVQAKLADPLGWHSVGRRWRKADEVSPPTGAVATVITDAVFAAGAGASGDVVTTVTADAVEVALDLPSAVARGLMRAGERPGSYPRPSTGAQVAVTAILQTGGAAHQAVVDAVRGGDLPAGWSALGH